MGYVVVWTVEQAIATYAMVLVAGVLLDRWFLQPSGKDKKSS